MNPTTPFYIYIYIYGFSSSFSSLFLWYGKVILWLCHFFLPHFLIVARHVSFDGFLWHHLLYYFIHSLISLSE
ncbi:hypothetical protein Hanom_Chr02g00129171 [Helianthus anomalus]